MRRSSLNETRHHNRQFNEFATRNKYFSFLYFGYTENIRYSFQIISSKVSNKIVAPQQPCTWMSYLIRWIAKHAEKKFQARHLFWIICVNLLTDESFDEIGETIERLLNNLLWKKKHAKQTTWKIVCTHKSTEHSMNVRAACIWCALRFSYLFITNWVSLELNWLTIMLRVYEPSPKCNQSNSYYSQFLHTSSFLFLLYELFMLFAAK